jgi:nicotinamide phosphoribosyltransferase
MNKQNNSLEKLNKSFKINPLYEADSYKIGHKAMLAKGTTREYWTWIPRSFKYMPKGIDKLVSGGQQLVWRYIHSNFKEHFFDAPITVAMKFGEDMSEHLGLPFDASHFIELHKLGFLPVRIKSLPEGILTKHNIPHMTGINTIDGYAWLGLYLETLVSKLAWQLPTAATIGYKFKQNAVEAVLKTDKENLWFSDFMCHDFHSRGGNPYTSVAVGIGHSFSNLGGDTINVIPASRYYYDFDENKVPIYSVVASEHSVTCTGLFYYDRKLRNGELDDKIQEYYSFDLPCDGSVDNPDYLTIAEWLNLRDWMKINTKGIMSCVADTMNLWKYITHVLARLKPEIMSRDGKIVVRPDSGDPVDIVCGTHWDESILPIPHRDKLLPHEKGVIELLWDIFGGTINSQGYKVLDSHIGAIYGDSINLERQTSIYDRLAIKGFAATNIVLGIGSFTYVMLTRDSAGFAAKGAWFEIKEKYTDIEGNEQYKVETFNIYKDPITDDGTKKSLKGFITVYEDEYGGYEVNEESTVEEENSGVLQVIYEDGNFYNQITLEEIRAKLMQQHV